MSEVTRYDLVERTRGMESWHELQERRDGDLVKFDDYTRELADAKAEIARLREEYGKAGADRVRLGAQLIGQCLKGGDAPCPTLTPTAGCNAAHDTFKPSVERQEMDLSKEGGNGQPSYDQVVNQLADVTVERDRLRKENQNLQSRLDQLKGLR